jgi:hypothetical protein
MLRIAEFQSGIRFSSREWSLPLSVPVSSRGANRSATGQRALSVRLGADPLPRRNGFRKAVPDNRLRFQWLKIEESLHGFNVEDQPQWNMTICHIDSDAPSIALKKCAFDSIA